MTQNLSVESYPTVDLAKSFICCDNFSIACSPVENESEHRTVVCLMISKVVSERVDKSFGRAEDKRVSKTSYSRRNQSINLNDYIAKPIKK